MEYRFLGRTGVKVSALCLGCLTLGREIDRAASERIIGRYLEHSRVFYFQNGGDTEIWAGSADWMNRNLRGRIEVVFPIEDPRLKARLYAELQLSLHDKLKGRILRPDGSYVRLEPEEGDLPTSFQDAMMVQAEGRSIGVDLPRLPEAGDASMAAS